MKKLFIVILLLCYFDFNFAQTSPVRTQLNTVFANINKSQVPTGFLQEYAEPLIPLDVFNGVLSDSNKVDINAWYMAYATLSSSRIYGVNPLADIPVVTSAIANDENANAGSLVVPMLFADYNYLRPDAITAHLLSASNNQLYDVAGRVQSPYAARKLFAATPSMGYAASGTPAFIFKQDIFYNASARTLSNIYIDFGDGRGYLPATWNVPIAAAYSASGDYVLKIKAVFADNTVMECTSPFRVTKVQQQYYSANNYYPGGAQSFYIAPTATHSGGTVYYQLSGNHTKITKPLIVAEGYDVHSIAPLLQDYNYSFDNFIADVNAPYPAFNFNSSLDDIAKYDLVFLDYNNGTDDITRNAALLQDAINWVNAQKAQVNSVEQNVVLGISMGGLVARYCLANMTKQNLNPQTRLLITHDSPHQGANTPLGLQALVRAFSEVGIVQIATHLYGLIDLIPELKQSIAVLDAPATKQMLILRATNGIGGYVTNTWLNTTYRNMITFPAGGPQPAYQTIATSLGSECGTGSLAPSTNLFHAGGIFRISPAPWIVRTSYNANVNANALPNYGPSQSIMDLHLWITIRILVIINIDIDLTNKSASSPANTLPWDGAPGGTQNVKDKIGASISPSSNSYTLGPFVKMFSSVSYAGDFCFVPTVSALDVTTLDQPALSKAYVGGVSPTDPTRVASFIAQDPFQNSGATYYNQSHPRFTARNAQWIFNLMEPAHASANAATLNCSSSCSTSYAGLLAGPSILCSSGTYVINNLPAGNSVTWTSNNTNALKFLNPNSGAAVTGSGNGPVTVSAIVNNNCGANSVPGIPVWAGKPTLNAIFINGTQPLLPANCSTGSLPFTAGPNQQTIEVSTDALASATNSFALSDPSGTVVGTFIPPNQYGFIVKRSDISFSVTINSTNSCGTTSQCILFSNGSCTPPAFSSITIDGIAPSLPYTDCSSYAFAYTAKQFHTIAATTTTGTSVTFASSDPNHLITSYSSTSTSFTFKANTDVGLNAGFSIVLSSSNACGSVGQCLYFTNTGGNPYLTTNKGKSVVFPNPASTVLNVQIDSLATTTTLDQSYQLKVVNRYSQTVYSIQSTENNILIPLDGLPNDIYYLNVFYNGAVLQKQIVIMR